MEGFAAAGADDAADAGDLAGGVAGRCAGLGQPGRDRVELAQPRFEQGAFLGNPTTHPLRIDAQQMQQMHGMTPDRDAKSAISGRDLSLPKLNVEGSIPFTRFIRMI